MQGYIKFKDKDEELYEVSIEERNKPKNFFNKIICEIINLYLKFIVKIKKYFNIITVKEIYYGIIFILPFSTYNDKKLKKIMPKLKKLMKRYKISTLVLSENLQKNQAFLEYFQFNRTVEKQIQILDGKTLMPYIIKEILEYILKKNNKSTLLEDLYIMVKKDNNDYKQNITFLSEYFKTINIITPCIKSYQKFANELEEKQNAIATVSNNKSKSLRKAKWIVNFDMLEEEINKFTIYQKATIIYLENEVAYKSNAFSGLHVCIAGIDVSNEIKEFFEKHHLLKQASVTVLYESTISKKKSFKEIRKQMEKDKVMVTKLYGLRGPLEEKEYEKST